MSLRARLLLGMGVIALVLTLSAVGITRATRNHLVNQIDAQLLDAGPQLRGGVGGGGWGPYGGPDGQAPRFSNLYVGLLSREGALSALHVPDLREGEAPVPEVTPAQVGALRDGQPVTVGSNQDARYRLVARIDRDGVLGVLGLSLDDVDSAVRRLTTVLAIAVATVLGVLALVTWWVIRLGVRPVRRMTETAGAIAGGDLSQRVPEGDPGTEAGELGVALNQMLGRIEEAFEQRSASEARLRQFVGDASHELRTPVTTIRGYAELYRTGALDERAELDEAMRRTEQEAVRMGTLVDDLLRLARLDQGRPLQRSAVDLSTLAADAVRDAGARSPDRVVRLHATDPVIVDGDEDALRQVVGNVVTNALVHAPDAPVDVRVHDDGDHAVVEVADAGPGMAPTDAARAFERFYRADASRARHRGGSGLGLAIVDATVRAHGGRATLESELGVGTIVRVELPRTVTQESPAPPAVGLTPPGR
jgi:two-component system OmpR family sensor kinase